MVLGSVWNFLKRHRRKFIFTGVLVSGGYLLYKYAQSKLKELQENEAAECLAHARKQHHFDSNQRTCNMTVLSMLPNVRETLIKALDTEGLTLQLKSKPSNKIEIWEMLKITSFARTISAIYITSLLVVFMRVQMNIIGGYMYLDNLLGRNGTSQELAQATPSVQHKYLESVQYLMNQGLHDMIDAVKRSVQAVVGSIPLKQGLSLQDIDGILKEIREKIEGCTSDKPTSQLCSYIISQEHGTDEAQSLTPEELMLFRLHKETKDMVESADFQYVLSKCLDSAFSKMLDRTADYYRTQMPNGFVNPRTIQLAMARLIPAVDGMIHSICSDAPNPFIQELLLMEPVKDLAANVYEAFSQQNDNEKQ